MMNKYGLKGPKRKSLQSNSIITGINSILFRLCQNYSCQPILVAGAVVPEDSLHQSTARALHSFLQADDQLVDPPRQVEVLLQPGDTLAVEREDLQGRDRVIIRTPSHHQSTLDFQSTNQPLQQ